MEQSKLLTDVVRLTEENKALQQQLLESVEYIQSIKKGNIDALLSVDNNNLKIYTARAADQTYRLLVENMHEGAVILNKDGVILYCNSYFAKMIKLPLQKVIGGKFKRHIKKWFSSHFEKLLQRGWSGGVQDEFSICADDRTELPVLISINTLLLEEGNVLSIILSDLTAQKSIQEELRKRSSELEQKNLELEAANKDLTTFTYISSHDLQEPLRKIHNFVQVLTAEEAPNLSQMGKVYFAKLEATTQRMQNLIDDLLIYSQTKAGERIFVTTDLRSVVEQVTQDYAELILKSHARIECDSNLKVRVILFQFNQLVRNLIWNSIKFARTSVDPVITITTEIVNGRSLNLKGLSKDIDHVHIKYSDNGIGFENQYSQRIFEVFQRLNQRESYEGTGMGLAICKRIIENHQGSITASGEINVGATFDIYIPA